MRVIHSSSVILRSWVLVQSSNGIRDLHSAGLRCIYWAWFIVLLSIIPFIMTQLQSLSKNDHWASIFFYMQLFTSLLHVQLNRPLPSFKNPHFQNEARCTTFLVKMSFICMRMKNDFHIKGWAPTLVLKERPGGTRKWPIPLACLQQNIKHYNRIIFAKLLSKMAHFKYKYL